MKHIGNCFCGAVEVEVSGAPEAMGYCHCRSCRSWSGGPVNAFSLWKPDAVRITAGKEHVATFSKTPLSERKYCKKCGGHLMTNPPPISLVDVDRLQGRLTVGVLAMGTSYVFNPSGQVIDASGLVAIFDAEGPTGTPVKDAQRTKTHDGTRTTLSIVWGSSRLPGRTQATTGWYRQLVATIPGTTVEDVALVS